MHSTCSTGIWLTDIVSTSILPGRPIAVAKCVRVHSANCSRKQFANLFADVVRSHESLAHENRADTGLLQLEHVVSRPDTAFADEKGLRNNLRRKSDRVLQVGDECPQ